MPDGIPVLRLQGTPGSRFSRYPIPQVWERLGSGSSWPTVPASAPRPGCPGAAPRPSPDDLVELLDHLGLDRVPVIGGSGGGPHVLALGARHPVRVSAATVVVGAAPLAGHRESLRDAPPEDHAVMSDPDFQKTLKRTLIESLRPGAEGWCDEDLAMFEWDIAPEEVRGHVVWYHSRNDANVPLQAALRVVDRLPSVDLRLWDGGHLEMFHHEEEVMRDLLSRAEAR